MTTVAPPAELMIARCTLGYAWALAMYVYGDGWTAATRLLLEKLTTRIALWHGDGISGAWS